VIRTSTVSPSAEPGLSTWTCERRGRPVGRDVAPALEQDRQHPADPAVVERTRLLGEQRLQARGRSLLIGSAICLRMPAAGCPDGGCGTRTPERSRLFDQRERRLKIPFGFAGKPTMKSDDRARSACRAQALDDPPIGVGGVAPVRGLEHCICARLYREMQNGISLSMPPCASIRSEDTSRGCEVVQWMRASRRFSQRPIRRARRHGRSSGPSPR
jgi:hypothetical protein